MDYVFSQHDLGYLDDVIPEKDKKKKEDEKKKKQKKKGSIDSEIDFVSVAAESTFTVCVDKFQNKTKTKHPCQCCPSLLPQSDYPYHESIPTIKISMDMMEQEPMLRDKCLHSEYKPAALDGRSNLPPEGLSAACICFRHQRALPWRCSASLRLADSQLCGALSFLAHPWV